MNQRNATVKALCLYQLGDTSIVLAECHGLTYEFHAYLQVLLPVNLLVHSVHLSAGLWTISNTPNRQRMLLLLRASTKTQLHSTCLCVLAQQVTNLLFFPSSAGEVSGASYRHCSVFYHLQVAPIDVAASIRHNCFFLMAVPQTPLGISRTSHIPSTSTCTIKLFRIHC